MLGATLREIQSLVAASRSAFEQLETFVASDTLQLVDSITCARARRWYRSDIDDSSATSREPGEEVLCVVPRLLPRVRVEFAEYSRTARKYPLGTPKDGEFCAFHVDLHNGR